MLHSRIQFMLKYLEDVKSGVIPIDNDILRQIASVCRRCPLMTSETFNEQFMTVNRTILLNLCWEGLFGSCVGNE